MAVATKRRKNKKITNTTNMMVPIRVRLTSSKAWRIDTERSFTGVSDTDSGICVFNSGRAWFTASTTLTVLAPGWRWIARVMEFSPFSVAQVLMTSTLSCTRATSRKRTGTPPLLLMIRSANSRAELICLLACSTRVCCGPSKVPAGVLTLAALSAALNSSKPMLRAARAAGSTRTRTAKRLAP